jgi:hypothetical protein
VGDELPALVGADTLGARVEVEGSVDCTAVELGEVESPAATDPVPSGPGAVDVGTVVVEPGRR